MKHPSTLDTLAQLSARLTALQQKTQKIVTLQHNKVRDSEVGEVQSTPGKHINNDRIDELIREIDSCITLLSSSAPIQ